MFYPRGPCNTSSTGITMDGPCSVSSYHNKLKMSSRQTYPFLVSPHMNPTDPTENVGLTGSMWEGLESSARVWNQVQTTGRSASTQTQRRPKKSVFLSQDFKQEWSHFGPRNPKLGSQRVSRKHAGKPREGSGNLGAGTSSICRRDQIQAAKPGQAGQRRNQK